MQERLQSARQGMAEQERSRFPSPDVTETRHSTSFLFTGDCGNFGEDNWFRIQKEA